MRLHRALSFLPAIAALFASSANAAAPETSPTTIAAESFTLGYGSPKETILPLQSLAAIPVRLELRDGVYHAPATPAGGELCAVGQKFPEGKFSESALIAIFQAIAKRYNERGIYGVFVVVNRDDVDPQTHEDYRPATRKDLRLSIWVSRVSEMRTIAKGTRFPPNRSIDNPAHDRIAKYSPLQADTLATRPDSILWKQELDDYLLDLNRHPARRVDAAISAGATPGEVTLDYLVSEKRPWFAYAQVSDSGTDTTDNLRFHAGVSLYQLTNYDDTLLVDASTTSDIESGFSASISYNRPLIYPNTLRGKIFAAYSEFTAEDLALALDEFSGYSLATGAELIWSPFRVLGFSVDFAPGITWQKFYTDNTSISQKADASILAGLFSIRLERNTDTMRTYLRIGYEYGDTGLAENELYALGRLEVQPDYHVANCDFSHTMFIEPLLFGEKFYSGDSWRKSARAHEIAVTARGQWSVTGERLIPQKMMTLGGMYTVRGYPEATVSGDNVYMGSFEYRLHIPRLFRPYALPRDRGDRVTPRYFGIPVNWRAPGVHALPDWDFILRLFGDIGRAEVIDTLPWEASHTLASIGFGVEAQFKGFLNARIDWGFAQKTVRTNGRDVENNSSQAHFTLSLLW